MNREEKKSATIFCCPLDCNKTRAYIVITVITWAWEQQHRHVAQTSVAAFRTDAVGSEHTGFLRRVGNFAVGFVVYDGTCGTGHFGGLF